MLIPFFFTRFHYSFRFTPLHHEFQFNFGLNFNNLSLFHLSCKILFGFFPIKEISLGLLELASKHKRNVGTSNQLFVRGSYTERKFSKKIKQVLKIRFFLICWFWTPHSICLNIGFWQGSFVSDLLSSLRSFRNNLWEEFDLIADFRILYVFRLLTECRKGT